MVFFIDSSVFIAHANSNDIHHEKAKHIFRHIKKYGTAITSDYIFDEVISVLYRKTNRGNAIHYGKLLLDAEIFLAGIDKKDFHNAWLLFQEKNTLNFTDCTTLAFMKRYSIQYIATFDKEFHGKGVKIIEE